MSKYSKLKKEFLDFIATLNGKQTDLYLNKLINLILEHFDEVAGCGTAAGKRGQLLKSLIQTEGSKISNILNFDFANEIQIQKDSIQRLHSLQVEKFRGFTTKKVFDLQKQYILIYGANGSGKSSFCEALEYCLLDGISEASVKRINISEYVKNVDHGVFIPPILKAVTQDAELIEVKGNFSHFHFSFIEKCRIDSFARLSSCTPADQTNLLSILFGLEEFNHFVKEFTENIERYIPLESQKEKEYQIRLVEVEGYKKNKINYEEEINKIEAKKSLLSREARLGKTFSELDSFINGSGQEKGKLREIEEELRKEMPEKIDYTTCEDLFLSQNSIMLNLQEFRGIQEEYMQKIEEINLTELYNNLLKIEKQDSKVCPACETPLEAAVKNPFFNAKEKLDGLKSVSEMQQKRLIVWTNLVESTNNIVNQLKTTIDGLKKINKTIGISLPKELQTITPPITSNLNYTQKIDSFLQEMLSKKTLFEQFQEDLISKNIEHATYQEKKSKILEEQNALMEINSRITAIKSSALNYQDLLLKAKTEIETFETSNEQTLKEIEIEKKQIAENQKYIAAYKLFREKLSAYKETLPLKLVENLNDLTKEFYNSINRDDEEFELLAEVLLPTKANETIRISFRDNPSKFINALHVLSEGHIKCIGLSVLLAKCINSGLNILIFDDVVNAIDDDHRSGIAGLLFKNDHFKEKQIILTSHSEEFTKDIENLMFLKRDYERLVHKITFNKRSSKTIEPTENSFNYLKKAEDYLSISNKRDCLSNIRRALENITDSIWRKLIAFEKGKYNIEIKVILRHPSKKPDLMNLISSLRKAISSIDNDKLLKIKGHFEWFEGLETGVPRIWEFLNKGTHDEIDRDDFDQAIVRDILNRAISLEEVAKNKWVTEASAQAVRSLT